MESKAHTLESKGKPLKIWTDISGIEPEAMEQLYRISRMPFIYDHVAVMPDVHLGKGATVGSVIATKEAIMPAAVGVDIGCGMLAARTNLNASDLPDSLLKIRSDIEKIVPVGFDCHPDERFGKKLELKELSLYDQLDDKTLEKATRQVGTLGGGNHFIELCLDQENQIWIMLHSGSRNIGKTIAEKHITIAKGVMKSLLKNLEDPDLAYLTARTPEFEHYINDLFWCQEYALENRKVMFQNIVQALKKSFPNLQIEGEITSCHHNYVSVENHFGENVFVTRKGAIKAEKGDLGIIPGSMGTKSYIVRGKGNPESFNSCSHGAGRRMSRAKAKKVFTLEDLKKQTSGVECRKDSGIIDEIPGAYKDIDQVMENQSDLVEVVTILKQILCVKG